MPPSGTDVIRFLHQVRIMVMNQKLKINGGRQIKINSIYLYFISICFYLFLFTH
jgi:hypothetical protein